MKSFIKEKSIKICCCYLTYQKNIYVVATLSRCMLDMVLPYVFLLKSRGVKSTRTCEVYFNFI